jgi:hypothetical protein
MKLCSTVIFTAISLVLILVFANCGEEPEDDKSIGEVTITNIPLKIDIFDEPSAESRDTFKVYLLASNYMNPDKLPEAKGLTKISNTKLVTETNGSYTVKIKLEKPNPLNKTDPNIYIGPWSGTANFFSVVITPQDTTPYDEDAIMVKADFNLNKGKKTMNWNKLSQDFRAGMEGKDPLDFKGKTAALFTDVIAIDPEIKTE